MPHHRLILFSLALGACSDTGVKAFNAEPEAEITSHSSGQEVTEGLIESFRGRVSDPDHSSDDLTVTWYANEAITCEGIAPTEDGLATCDIAIPTELTEVVLEVMDPKNAGGSARIELSVLPSEAPVAEITTPNESGIYYSDQKVTFTGVLSDAEDSAADLVARWESDIDGELDVDATPTNEGEVTGFGYLTEGEHAVQLIVTDTTEKTGSTSRIVDVGPPNSAPTCGITAPEDNAADEEGSTVVFEALVADVDVPTDWLVVSWASDKDGELGESTPDSSGAVAFPYADLSVDTHVVTMTVSDEVGATCSDFILYSVGTPPSISIESPASGEAVEDGDTVRFEATISDHEDSPTDLVLSWVSDLDGEFSTQGSDSTGTILFDQTGLSRGLHSITATVTDLDGLFAQAILSLRINGVPTAPEIALTPDPATSEDDLVVTFTTASTDPDGDPVTYTYEWYADGVLSSASTTATLSASETQRDQTWTAVATPSDGYSEGTTGSDDIEIGNAPPAVSAVTLDPDPATAEDVLLCTWSYSDADSDADASTLEWTINGSSSGSDATLSESFSTGDVIVCTVSAHDGFEDGNSESASLTIANTPPVLSEVTLSPDPAYEGDTLSCEPGETTDADGTVGFDYTYAWEVDGVDIGEISESLESDSFNKDEEVLCRVTPNDGDDDGDSVDSNSITISNTPPELSSVSISPSNPTSSDTLSCSYSGFSDADGDSDSSTYRWTVNGSDVSTSSTVSSGFDATDTVSCTVTPDDGEDEGSALSDTVTIENSVPEITAVSLSPSTLQTDDTLTATVTTADSDGDTVTLDYAWYVDGTRTTETGNSLEGSIWFDKDEEVYVVVTPSDGLDTGSSMTSTSITVDNSPPSAPGISVDMDSVACTSLEFDANNDYVTVDASSDFTGSAFTVEAWIRWDGADAQNYHPVVQSGWFDSSTRAFDLTIISDPDSSCPDQDYEPGRVLFANESSDCILTESTLDEGTWHHVAGVIDGYDTRIYLDGTLEYSRTGATYGVLPSTDADHQFGYTGGHLNNYLNGAIDQIRYSNSARYSANFTPSIHLSDDTDTVGLWTFDEGSGSTTEDWSGSGNDADIVDGTWGVDGPDGCGDVLICAIDTASTDADGDSISLTMEWEVDGIAYTDARTTTEDGDTILYGLTEAAEVWTCTVTPDDGEDTGTSVSASTTINSPPGAPIISIDPGTPREGDADLVCQVDTDAPDVDGDPISYTFSWTVDGVEYTDVRTTYETGDTIRGSQTTSGEVWICTAVSNDGLVDGSSDTASVTIQDYYTSCKEILDSGASTGDGTYELDPEGTGRSDYTCDMTTDSGGWTRVVYWNRTDDGDGLTEINEEFTENYNDLDYFDEESDYLLLGDEDSDCSAAALSDTFVVPNSGEYIFEIELEGQELENSGVWFSAEISTGLEELICHDSLGVDDTSPYGYSSTQLSYVPYTTCSEQDWVTWDQEVDWDESLQGDLGSEITGFDWVTLMRGEASKPYGDQYKLYQVAVWVR